MKERYFKNREKLLEYHKEYREKNKEWIKAKNYKRKKEQQEKAINYLGGKCSRCFGVFPPEVYDFHHINPKEKDFILSEHWGDSKEM